MFNVLQSSSLIEWSFRKAIIIRTFSNYHPIPVPLNLLSQLGILLIQCLKFCRRRYNSRNSYSQIPHSGKTSVDDQADEEKVWWGLHRVKVSLRRSIAYSAFSRFKREGVYTIRLEKMLVNRQIACCVLDGTNSNSSRISRCWAQSTSVSNRKEANTRKQSKNGAKGIVPCCLSTKWIQRSLVLVEPAFKKVEKVCTYLLYYR